MLEDKNAKPLEIKIVDELSIEWSIILSGTGTQCQDACGREGVWLSGFKGSKDTTLITNKL